MDIMGSQISIKPQDSEILFPPTILYVFKVCCP